MQHSALLKAIRTLVTQLRAILAVRRDSPDFFGREQSFLVQFSSLPGEQSDSDSGKVRMREGEQSTWNAGRVNWVEIARAGQDRICH